ncbi:MAG: hypothetical protein IM599_04635 [Chitinophagaceae bacterium]|nr:hypothetical protein [Chitinophagaceae bacterium]
MPPLLATEIVDKVSPVLHTYDVPPPPVKETVPPAQNVVVPLGVIVAVGNGFTVTVVTDEVALQPFPSVAVTVMPPLLATEIVDKVSPVLHTYDVPPLPVKETVPPAQNVVVPLGVIVAVGNGFTVTVVTDEVALQPFPSVAVTVMLPLLATEIVDNVSPVLHIYDVPPPPVKETFPPVQNVVVPLGVIVAVGNGFTVTVVTDEVALQPFPSVAVTVMLPLLATEIVDKFEPVLHTYDVPPPPVKETVPPAQNVVVPLGVIVAVGKGFTRTEAAPDAEQPVVVFTIVNVPVNVPEPAAAEIATTRFPVDPVKLSAVSPAFSLGKTPDAAPLQTILYLFGLKRVV